MIFSGSAKTHTLIVLLQTVNTEHLDRTGCYVDSTATSSTPGLRENERR